MEYVMGLWFGFALGLLAAIIYAGLSAASDAEDAEDAVLAERMAAFRALQAGQALEAGQAQLQAESA